ncbi:sugar ABC transporter permease [Humibacter antri]
MSIQKLDTVTESLLVRETRPPVRPVRQKRRWLATLSRYKWFYLMLLPGVAYFVVFRYAPMGGAVIAFKNYVPFLGIFGSPWVGWAQFSQLFGSPDFVRLLSNTLILAGLNLFICFPLTIVVALLLNELRITVLKRSVQTLIYIPHFLAWTIVAALTYLLFAQGSGVLFNFFNGVFGTHVDFLTSPGWFRPLIILQSIWKSTGWGTIIYLAALAGVDPNQYEAAVIDGAGRWSRTWHVTLPAIRGTIVVMLILSMGSILNTGFEQIYLMTNSLNRGVADVFDTYVYFVGISQGSYSYATAVGLFKAIIGVILIGGANWVAKRLGQDGIF